MKKVRRGGGFRFRDGVDIKMKGSVRRDYYTGHFPIFQYKQSTLRPIRYRNEDKDCLNLQLNLHKLTVTFPLPPVET